MVVGEDVETKGQLQVPLSSLLTPASNQPIPFTAPSYDKLINKINLAPPPPAKHDMSEASFPPRLLKKADQILKVYLEVEQVVLATRHRLQTACNKSEIKVADLISELARPPELV